MTNLRIASRAAAIVAATTMAVSPAMATRTVSITAPLSAKPAPLPGWTPADDVFANHRRNRGGSTVGNVLTGLLVIGGIAAVAKAIDKDQEKRRRDRTQGRDYPYRDGPYTDEPYDYRDSDRDGRDDSFGRGDSREANRAVDACAAEAQRSGRVDEILDVNRVGDEWRVRGDYDDGRAFSCSVDRNGRAYVGLDSQASNGWNTRGSDEDPVARPYDPQADEDDRYAASDADDYEDVR